MRYLLLLLLVSVLVIGCSEEPADRGDAKKPADTLPVDTQSVTPAAPGERRFDVRSGSFDRRATLMRGDTVVRVDRHRVYFDDYGSRVIWFTEAQSLDDTTRAAMGIDRGRLLVYSTETGEALPLGRASEKHELVPAYLDPKTTIRMREAYGYQPQDIGTEEMLGRRAQGYRWTGTGGMTIEEWVWKGISLRTTTPTLVDEVVRIETDITHPPGTFNDVSPERIERELNE